MGDAPSLGPSSSTRPDLVACPRPCTNADQGPRSYLKRCVGSLGYSDERDRPANLQPVQPAPSFSAPFAARAHACRVTFAGATSSRSWRCLTSDSTTRERTGGTSLRSALQLPPPSSSQHLRADGRSSCIPKALTLLDYCLHAGSENVVIYFKDNLYIIKSVPVRLG